jgi:predicted DsbA family dithiol-disulfide isomerase
MMNADPVFELFSDFNCPFCYALHERLHDLKLINRCEWRGVQHASHLPRPMKPWQGSLGAELRHEVAVVQRLAPGLPIALPPGKPNTRLAIERATGLLMQDRTRGMEFVRQAYRAFWCEGRDISDPQVLRDLSEESVEEGATDHIRRIAQGWEAAWHATGQAGVPLIVSPDGDLLVGCVPGEDIAGFFHQKGT